MAVRMTLRSGNMSSASPENTSASPPGPVYVTPMPTTAPTRAKYGRYNKKQYCLYCQKPRSKLARHLEHVHRSELEVAQAFSYDKKSKERRVMLQFLKRRGNFMHNAKVSSAGTGEMVPCRRPSTKKEKEDFKHCVHCQGMYAKESLWRHMRYCPQKPVDGGETVGRKRVQSLDYLSLPPPEDISKAVWKIACEMNNDEVAAVVKHQKYILLLGQQLYNKIKSPAGRSEYIRQKMREVARLVIKARTMSPLKDIQDFILPCNFSHVLKAVKVVAGYREESNTYKISPSLALKLGHSLKKIAGMVECNALKLGDGKMAELARNFATLYGKKWNEFISASALNTLSQEKWNKPQLLPFTEDVKKLHFFLDREQKTCMSALQAKPTNRNYANLCKVTLTQLILFNRRREGDVSKMLMTSYTSRDQNQLNEDVAVGLSSFEKKLCDYFQSVEICGKKGRNVPVLMAPHMVAAMDLLVEKRDECGVPRANEYMFARSAALSHYRGSDSLRCYATACGVKNPRALSSSKLRKQVATLSTVLNMKENEMDQLANFLGHDIRIHREFYRLPESTLQLAKVSKVLIAMEKGRLTELQGNGLDDITLNPQVEVDVSSDGSSGEDEPTVLHQTCSTRTQGSSSVLQDMDDYIHDETGSSVEMKQTHSKRTQGSPQIRESTLQETIGHACQTSSKPVNEKRKWENAEVQAIERHLLHFISSCKVPGKKDCVSCLLAEPVALKDRSWSAVKFYVYNRVTALKRRMR